MSIMYKVEKKGGNNMKRRIILISILTMTVVSLLTGCGQSKKDLRNELEKANVNVSELQIEVKSLKEQISELELENTKITQQADANANETFLALTFPSDGNFYKVSDEEFNFYSDQRCESKVSKDIKIISPIIEERKRDNGFIIYICMSDKGLVYSTSWPNLVVDEN